MKPTGTDKAKPLVWGVSAVFLLVLAINLESLICKTDEAKAKSTADLTVTRAPELVMPREVPQRKLVSSQPPLADVAAVYASEEFAHVPEWIPRLPHAVSAAAEDATLRSDGLREGTVRFTLASGLSATTEWLGQTLAQAGLHAGADASSYASESPPRHCEVKTESISVNLTRITLRYEASDHSQGCVCPTCHVDGSPSE